MLTMVAAIKSTKLAFFEYGMYKKRYLKSYNWCEDTVMKSSFMILIK